MNTIHHQSGQKNSGSWRKSSFSMSAGDCVEVAIVSAAHVGVRDSRAPARPHLRFPFDTWVIFLGDVRASRSGIPFSG
jgi:hypothetical protein